MSTELVESPPPLQPPRTPPLEAERLAALHCMGLLDTPPVEAYDRITRLAGQFLDAPIVLVSLVDAKRQWFKSRYGLNATETSRDISFCGHAVYNRALLKVADATRDPRFAGNPLVLGEPHIRAYMGVPIYSREGHAIGTLCVIDVRPRQFDAREEAILNDLAKILQEAIQADELTAANESLQRRTAERDRLFRDTFEQAAVGMVHTSLDGNLLRVNQRFADLLGYSSEELSGMSFIDFTHQDDLASSVGQFNAMVAGTVDGYTLEKRFIRGDGALLWGQLSVALKRKASGEPDYLISVLEDIGERKRAQADLLVARDSLQAEISRQTEELKQSNLELRANIKRGLESERAVRRVEHRMRSIADNVPAMIGYWNRDLVCEFANKQYSQYFAHDPRQIVGMAMQALLGDMMFETVEPHVRIALTGKAQRFERTVVLLDGTDAIIDIRYIPDCNDANSPRGFFVLASDVTEARRARGALEVANARLTKETVTDFLTGISNRRVFSERSEEASRRFSDLSEGYGLILMDLDNFKTINDTHGHDVGDDVLRVVGQLLKSQLRSHRDIAARLGGEEFAILCFGEVDEEILVLIAERLRVLMSNEVVNTATGPLNFTCSFGLATSSTTDTGWKNIYSRADSALYDAKAAGKDRVRFGSACVPGATGHFRALRVAPVNSA